MNKLKNIIVVSLLAVMILSMSVWGILKKPDSYSESERRALKGFPEITAESISSGDFMTGFEDYSLDQFPLREGMRSIKAASELYLFNKGASNDLYIKDGYISKIEYPLNEAMLDHAADRFKFIYDSYLKDNCAEVYLSIIPDKHYFLGEENGYLSLDYDKLISEMRERTEYMEYINILPLLSIEDYYKTDSHWRQENICDVAKAITHELGVDISANYDINSIDSTFYGVYSGQIALPFEGDELKYLTGGTMDAYTVLSYDTGTPTEVPLYDMDAAAGRDPYEMFLSGTQAVISIENPKAASDKELIVFRDSYAGSLGPLLAEGYSKITFIDIRYIRSDILGNMVDFNGQDVLFIYSTTLLNNSLGLK